MANVWLVEKRYGTIGGLYKALGAMEARPGETVEQALSKAMIGPLVEALACFMPRGPLRDAEELAEHLAAKDISQFGAALGEVFRIAFADVAKPAEASTVDGQGNVPKLDQEMLAAAEPGRLPPMPPGAYPPGAVPLAPWLPQAPSPGVTSGTPAPSSSAAPTSSSGG